jgi:hypothetical protein
MHRCLRAVIQPPSHATILRSWLMTPHTPNSEQLPFFDVEPNNMSWADIVRARFEGTSEHSRKRNRREPFIRLSKVSYASNIKIVLT